MGVFPDTPDERFKRFVYEQFSRIGKALSAPGRLIILNILCQGEHTVEALAKYSGLNVANVSRHLQILKSVGLVRVRREGKNIFYRPADRRTCAFFNDFKEFAHNRLSEIRTALQEIAKSPSRFNPVSREELVKKVFEEDVFIIDVRPEEEYKSAHLPNAVSIPLDELEKSLNALPKDKAIVAYCRGRFCILADQAVDLLLNAGFAARRADDGVVEWKLAGLPVEEAEQFKA